LAQDNPQRSDVLIIGGGVIGVCTAHSLAERGVSATLLERAEICSGASYGNAGWICSSLTAPIAGPGTIRHALPWLLDPESPLYIRPRPSLALMRWLWRFQRACNQPAMRRSFQLRRALALASLERHAALAKLEGVQGAAKQRGLLVAYRTGEALRDAESELALLEAEGGSVRRLDAEAMSLRMPALRSDLAGGLELPIDAHLTPDLFVTSLAAEAARRGAVIRTRTEVLGIEWSRGRPVRVDTTRGVFHADEVVVAAGAWTPQLTRDLGLRIPIEAAKGYSLTVERPENHPELPVMLEEAKVGVTPMGSRLRFAGTLELAGLDLRVSRRRVDAIARAVRTYLPNLPSTPTLEIWRGLRPLSPDDLPMLGRPRGTSGLIVASGHGMHGIALGPITGELIAQLATGEQPSFDLAPFAPDRF
jgi:D-amino-acid dehydrogenase